MIYLYSGTPGSGKSLDVARVIYYSLKRKLPVICNFEINQEYVSNYDLFSYVENQKLNPSFLINYASNYWNGRNVKEGTILLVIDECQLMFNARSWNVSGRDEWNSFFTQHRKYGYDIILVAQFDRMIDRQIRSLIEYEVIHRKVKNYGIKGYFLMALMLSPTLFVKVKMWYPMKEKVGSEFFKAKKKYYRLYNTYSTFTQVDNIAVPDLGALGDSQNQE